MQKSRPERSLGGIMDKQWTNAVCRQRKKPVNCVFTDSALVEVTGLEPTAPTSRTQIAKRRKPLVFGEMRNCMILVDPHADPQALS